VENESPSTQSKERFHVFERIPLVLSHFFLSGKVTSFSKEESLGVDLEGDVGFATKKDGAERNLCFPSNTEFSPLISAVIFSLTSLDVPDTLHIPGFGEIFQFNII